MALERPSRFRSEQAERAVGHAGIARSSSSKRNGWTKPQRDEGFDRYRGLLSGQARLLAKQRRLLAKAAGCQPRTARECLAKLETLEWIVRIIDPQRRNRIEIVMFVDLILRGQSGRRSGSGSPSSRRSKSASGWEQNCRGG